MTLRVLFVACSPALVRATRERLGRDLRCVSFDGPEPAIRSVRSAEPALKAALETAPRTVLVCGQGLGGAHAARFLERINRDQAAERVSSIVLWGGDEVAAFQGLADRDELFYLSPKGLGAEDLAELIHAALAGDDSCLEAGIGEQDGAKETHELDDIRRLRRALAFVKELQGQSDIEPACRLVRRALCEVLGAERAYVLELDREKQTLFARGEDEQRAESPAAGLIGFVTRSGRGLRISRVEDDARYDRESDDPLRPARDDSASPRAESLLVEPIPGPKGGRESAGQSVGVLVVVRSVGSFEPCEMPAVRLLATELGVWLERWTLRRELDEYVSQQASGRGQSRRGLYLEDALRAYAVQKVEGQPLDLSPTWVERSYGLLVWASLAALLFLVFGSIRDHARGPAVVRVEGIDDVVAPVSGTVTEVFVSPGQEVSAGETLIRLYDAEEASELERRRRAFDLQLVERLLHPADEAIQRTLGEARSELERARSQFEARRILARSDGVVRDIRAQHDQSVEPGDVLLTVATPQTSLSLVALIPGHYRPQIEQGASLRFEVAGYQHTYQELRVDHLGQEIIAPREASRILGPDVAPSLVPSDPVFVIEARLPEATFLAQSEIYDFYDGMAGTANIQVKEEPILLRLLPALKRLTGGGYG